jgi:hypothetical protein
VVQNNQVTQNSGALMDIFEFTCSERTELICLEPNQLSPQSVDYQTFAKALEILTTSPTPSPPNWNT